MGEGVKAQAGSAKSIWVPIYLHKKGDRLETGDGAQEVRDLRA